MGVVTPFPRRIQRQFLRVGILEDEERTAKGVEKLLEQGAASLEIDLEVEWYASLPRALAGLLDFKPDIITQDLGGVWQAVSTSFNDEITGMASISVLRELFRQQRLDTKIVVISRLDEPRVVGEAVGLGVCGYFQKEDLETEEPRDVVSRLMLLQNGGSYRSPRAEAAYRRWLHIDDPSDDPSGVCWGTFPLTICLQASREIAATREITSDKVIGLTAGFRDFQRAVERFSGLQHLHGERTFRVVASTVTPQRLMVLIGELELPPMIDLSISERQVLWPLAGGATYVEVGKALRISPRTVESHVCHVRNKIAEATGAEAPVKAQNVARRALGLDHAPPRPLRQPKEIWLPLRPDSPPWAA